MYLAKGLLSAAVLFLTYSGLGKLVARFLVKCKLDWSLLCAWGMFIATLVGGVLISFKAISVTANICLFAVAIVCLLIPFPSRHDATGHKKWLRENPTFFAALIVLALIGLLLIVRSLFPVPWNPNDDVQAYAVFPKKMLETGDLYEPFSHRRIVAYGGNSYLLSLVLSLLPESALHLSDLGIGTVVTAFNILFLLVQLGLPWFAGIGASLAFMVWEVPRVNLSPTCMISLGAITLVRTFLLTREMKLPPWRSALLISLIAAGYLSIRSNVLAIGGSLTVLLYCFVPNLPRTKASLANRAKEIGLIGVFGILLIVPWAVALQRSSGTPLFPLIHGYYNTAIPLRDHLSLFQELSLLNWHLQAGLMFWLAGLTLFGALFRLIPSPIVCLACASLLSAIATVEVFTICDAPSLTRYYMPLIVPALVLNGGAVGGAVAQRLTKAIPANLVPWFNRIARPAALIFFLALASLVTERTSLIWYNWRWLLKLPTRGHSAEEMAVSVLPQGAHVLAMVTSPDRIDYRKWNVVNIDDVGTVSPPPGLPFGKDPEVLAAYLRSLKITYIMYIMPDFARDLFRRRSWEEHLHHPPLVWTVRAPYYLWFFDSVEALAKRYRQIYRKRAMVVLDLGSPVSPPSLLSKAATR